MPKQTKKTINRKVLTKKFLPAVIIIALILFIITFFIIKNFNESKLIAEQKTALEQSGKEIDFLIQLFNKRAPVPGNYNERPRNTCSKVGVKYSAEYTCGNKFVVEVINVTEDEYRSTEQQLTDDFINNSKFEVFSRTPPRYLTSTSEVTSSSGIKFENTELRCYLSSSYKTETRIAKLYGGCNLSTTEALFSRRD